MEAKLVNIIVQMNIVAMSIFFFVDKIGSKDLTFFDDDAIVGFESTNF
jgi:hypothetical protein